MILFLRFLRWRRGAVTGAINQREIGSLLFYCIDLSMYLCSVSMREGWTNRKNWVITQSDDRKMIPIPYTKLTPSYTPIRGSCRSLEYHNNARNWQHWAMILCWFNRSNSKTKLNEEHQRNRKALWKEIRRLCFYLTGYVSSLISSNSFYTTVLINLFRNNMWCVHCTGFTRVRHSAGIFLKVAGDCSSSCCSILESYSICLRLFSTWSFHRASPLSMDGEVRVFWPKDMMKEVVDFDRAFYWRVISRVAYERLYIRAHEGILDFDLFLLLSLRSCRLVCFLGFTLDQQRSRRQPPRLQGASFFSTWYTPGSHRFDSPQSPNLFYLYDLSARKNQMEFFFILIIIYKYKSVYI